MPLSNSTLSAIQKTGAAAFAAHVKLKDSLREYAERTHTAMGKNQDQATADATFASWKIVAGLAHAMAGVEEELKKIHEGADKLTTDDLTAAVSVPARAKPGPKPKEPTAIAQPVVVKAKKKPVKGKKIAMAVQTGPVEEAVISPKALPTKRVLAKGKKKAASRVAAKKPSEPANPLELKGNAAKLMEHFEKILNPNDFLEIQQSTTAKEVGLPMGSMTASIKKLTELGRIIAGPKGSLKLPLPQ